eukprot:gene3189-3660_t
MSRIYIGGLPPDASRREVEREFEYFGHLRDVWVARNPPGFGFIVYDDQRDAEDAVREMDGRRVCGSRVRVEFARGPTRGGGGGGGGARSRGGGGGRDNSCYECGRVGHTARQCTRKGEFDRGGSSRRRRSRSRNRLFDTKVTGGHLAKDHTVNPREGQGLDQDLDQRTEEKKAKEDQHQDQDQMKGKGPDPYRRNTQEKDQGAEMWVSEMVQKCSSWPA